MATISNTFIENEGRWVTINGNHVKIDADGLVLTGPMRGRDLDDAAGRKHANHSMSRDERFAIEDYSTDKFRQINGELRSGQLSPDTSSIVRRMDSALANAPKRAGATARSFELPSGPEGQRIAAMLKPGATFSDAAFVSTKLRPDPSEVLSFKSRSPLMGRVVLRIAGKSGVDISRLSLNPGEGEVLYPRGTKFRVTKAIHSNGGILAELEEIGDLAESLRHLIDETPELIREMRLPEACGRFIEGESNPTLSTIRDTAESDLEKVLLQLDEKHKALLRAAVKEHGVHNIPDSVWSEIQTNVEEGTVSAIILLLMMADDWTSSELADRGVDRRALSPTDGRAYSRIAAIQARATALETTRTLRDRLTRKLQDQALSPSGGVGDVTDTGIDEALDDVFNQSRRQTISIDTTTQAMSMGQRGAAERAGDGASVGGRRMTIALLWRTERDDRVCPRCSPLEGQPEEVWGRVFPSGPGPDAHPRCRCELEVRVVPFVEDDE